MMNRRDFLKYSGLVFFSSLFSFGLSGWAAGIVSNSWDNKDRKRLIVLFQRGAVDGLNIVIPYNEGSYFDSRPTLAIHQNDGAMQLDSRFSLNPALDSVEKLWKDKTLAFIHACGSPDPSRSHFDAQDFMETGTPGVRSTKDGWMNRLIGELSHNASNIQALSISSTLPRILQGPNQAVNIESAFNPKQKSITDVQGNYDLLEKLYKNDKDLVEAFREGQQARQQLVSDLEEERKQADNGAPYPNSFESNCRRMAQVIAKDPTMQIAFLDVGGWDTHFNQGGVKGQLANNLKPFGTGVKALAEGLGETYKDTLIVVVSEFGRTVRENGNQGTDHGHGNAMWVLGGPIKGGKVYGEWPGLAIDDLYEKRDLAVTTDFRNILGYVLGKHFSLDQANINAIFPNTPSPGKSLASYSAIMG